jgi:TRAP-type transport system periplasmic protein
MGVLLLKRKFLLLLSVVLAGILVLAGCGGSKTNNASDSGEKNGASKEVIEMNVSNFNPSTHHYAYNVYEPWKKLVEEKSDGRIKVNLYHGGTLGKSSTVLEDVGGGLADVGLVVSTYYYDTKFFPYTIGNLPFAVPDSAKGAKVMTKFGEKYAKDAFEDVHYLGGVTTTDAYDLFATKPVKNIKDVKGLKMRVQGKGDTQVVENWGAVPVSLPLEEFYEALEKGTLDTGFYTPIGAVGNKYYEAGPYITKMGITVTPLIPVMNNDFYEKLPDDLKKMFDEEFGPRLSELFTESYTKEVDNAYKELEKQVKGKGEFITPSAGDLSGFKKSSKSVWDDWVKDADKMGYPGEEMMKEFKKLLKEEGVELPF